MTKINLEKQYGVIRNEIIEVAEKQIIKDSNKLLLHFYNKYKDKDLRKLIENLILKDTDLQFKIKDPNVIFSRELIYLAEKTYRIEEIYTEYIEKIESLKLNENIIRKYFLVIEDENNLRKYFYENQDVFNSIFHTDKFSPLVINNYENMLSKRKMHFNMLMSGY